jgi:hypothetical protein
VLVSYRAFGNGPIAGALYEAAVRAFFSFKKDERKQHQEKVRSAKMIATSFYEQ